MIYNAKIMPEHTLKQVYYCANRLDGYPPTEAARLAGYSDNGTSMIRVTAHRLERNPRVQALMEHMYDAMCSIALEAFKTGKKLSPRAQAMLCEWPGATEQMKALIKARMDKRRLEDAISVVRGCLVPDTLANSWITA